METTQTTTDRESRLAEIRDIFKKLVELRIRVLEIAQWAERQGDELEAVADELEGALNSLGNAENAISDAHKNLMAADVIMSMKRD